VNQSLEAAYASCERDVRAHYENFPVASLLIPSRMRRHVAALYAFARAADDFADEGKWSIEERHRLLDGWVRRLHDAVSRDGHGDVPARGEPPNASEIFVALGATIREKALPMQLFEDLVSAFRQDVTVTRYATWQDLRDYCRRSADPVGRLVLRIAGYRDERLDTWSDAICTALQLTNFWQDLAVDFTRGRIYVPAELLAEHGALEQDLARGRLTSAWQQALEAAVLRTSALFTLGRPLCAAVRGRLRYELRATWLGGIRILDRLEASGFDPIGYRPRLRLSDAPWFAWRMIAWSSTEGSRRPSGSLNSEL
jgi:hydroxysqualene synthase